MGEHSPQNAERLFQRIQELRSELDDAERSTQALLAIGHLAALKQPGDE